MTIFLGSKSWNINIVNYRPASFIPMQVSWNVYQSWKIEGTCLLMDLLKKIIFSSVICHQIWRWYLKRKVGLNEIIGLWNSLFKVLSSEESAISLLYWYFEPKQYNRSSGENQILESRYFLMFSYLHNF